VGSYDQVAERIAAFHRAGVDTLLVQFQPYESEMRRFAAEVMPRVRALTDGDGRDLAGMTTTNEDRA
jgi:alkanesulfonate monooxygenase